MKSFGLLLVLLGLAGSLSAQDPILLQPFANRLLLNPALTGADVHYRVMAQAYRFEVAGLGSYQTYGLSYEQGLSLGRRIHRMGVHYQADQSLGGNLGIQGLWLSYALPIQLGRKAHLRLGLNGGIRVRQIDAPNLRFPDQIDPRTGFVQPTIPFQEIHTSRSGDMDAGAAFFFSELFVMASLHHLVQPSFTFGPWTDNRYKYNRRLQGMMGYQFQLGSDSARHTHHLTPIVAYRYQGGQMFRFGLTYEVGPLSMSAWYLTNQTAVFSLGGHILGWTLGVSYQYVRQEAIPLQWGPGWELSLAKNWNWPSRSCRIKRYHLPIPKF